MNILTNKWFWIILAIIIAAIIIRRKWSSIKQAAKNVTQTQDIDYQPGESVNINQVRKDQLQKAASGIYTDIQKDTPGRDPAPYNIADQSTDNELRFLAKYYSDNLSSGVSLYEDMDGEYYSFYQMGDLADRIKVRLAKMGLR